MVRRLGMVLIIGLLALGILPLSAGSDQGAAFTLDCNGFTGVGGGILLNRDNTANNREAFIVSATDGAGNVIYAPIEDTFFVGGLVSWTGSPQVKWTRTPEYNPLVLRVVSRAGNGFDEKLITLALGACAGLPTFDVLPSGVFVVDGDTLVLGTARVPLGDTSPSVPLNAEPPRPVSDPAALAGLPAVFIVNTDNLSLRSGAGPEYTLVGIVDGGTLLAPLGRSEDFAWWYVQAGSIVGWAKAEFIVLRGDATGVPVVPSMGELIGPSLFVHLENLPLYSAPDTFSLPLCTIAGDQEYKIVGRDNEIAWYEIQTVCDGVLVNGWMPAELGSVRNPAALFIPVTTG